MQKPNFILMIFLIPTFLIGCAPKAESNLEKYRMPTDVPSAAQLVETEGAATAASTPPDNCPVTVPQEPPFIPPAPYSEQGNEGDFWYGSNALWISFPRSGVWSKLPHDSHGYSQKIPWWSEGYDWQKEPQPALQVTGERLDAKVPPLNASTANGAYVEGIGSAMTMGADFPSFGCWKITGKYKEAELGFVVWLAP